ncbi:unnamed protein product, partial [Brassica rapa]
MEYLQLPKRMFAVGEESAAIGLIRRSRFGWKIISQAKNASSSGCFGQFVV